jgi:hypothetical protein
MHQSNVANEVEAKYLLRKHMHAEVVVAAQHPTLGQVYWYFVDESDCNAPDHYGLTLHVDLAHRMLPGWRSDQWTKAEGDIFMCNVRESMTRDVDCELFGPPKPGADEHALDVWYIELVGDMADMAEAAGGTSDEFLAWVDSAKFLDVVVEPQTLYLQDLNGFVDYKPEWTDASERALTFSQPAVLGGDDEFEPLTRLGTFVQRPSKT